AQLVERGHRRIALAIPGGDAMQAHIYLSAWQRAMKRHGLAVPAAHVPPPALAGGAAVMGADLVARTVAAPTQLPVGVVTALAGVPVFLWMLLRRRTR
ncbi:iron chelate uptake ABC transporter family permease subunit, partial [Paraburkholderia sp. Ac-20347]|uniref:iron chelate uptake ABC transporter family permease subunit n=1 Tax=Paraburkholderia sp. Ac-20347 TaxID=2703892 RepID=UPI00197D2E7B